MSDKLPLMKAKEITKILEKMGFELLCCIIEA